MRRQGRVKGEGKTAYPARTSTVKMPSTRLLPIGAPPRPEGDGTASDWRFVPHRAPVDAPQPPSEPCKTDAGLPKGVWRHGPSRMRKEDAPNSLEPPRNGTLPNPLPQPRTAPPRTSEHIIIVQMLHKSTERTVTPAAICRWSQPIDDGDTPKTTSCVCNSILLTYSIGQKIQYCTK